MKNFLVFMFFFIVCACSNSVKTPSHILTFEQMQKVTWECIQTDEYLINYVFRDSSIHKDSISAVYYEKIFSLNKTNKKQFFESLNYYQSKPDVYKKLMDTISVRGFRSKKQIELEFKKRIKPILD